MKYLNLFWLLLLALSCKNDKSVQENSSTKQTIDNTSTKLPLNIVVLLDLSSRVKLPNQVAKDTLTIKSVLNTFENLQRKYAFMASKDKISILSAYQSASTYDGYKIGNDKFMIDMLYQASKPMNKPIFDQKRVDLENAVRELYSAAVKSPTDGADIWGFFCNDWHNFYQASMHNKIIILTDGYLQFDKSITTKRAKGTYMTGLEKLRNKPNWEAVFAAQKLKLNACPNPIENTEVLVLEIAPQNKSVNTNEIQIIQKFWKTWFNDMHLKSDIFDTNDGDINKGKINEFLMK